MRMRDLPSVDALASVVARDTELPPALVVAMARKTIDTVREALAAGEEPPDPAEELTALVASIAASRPTRVINATGVLLHTNLGRAPLPADVAADAAEISRSASNVEIDVATGKRSRRSAYLEAILPVVTGAEAGFAVNNNAGALLLALASTAGRGKVAVSRGELIEIGGSFRLPSLMEASGATLVEVGTTNRTRRSDYEAVADRVDAILKVHPSNYRIDGFREEASWEELASLATQAGIPFIADIGSGLVDASAPWLGDRDRRWLADEPGVRQTVATGANLVLFSGDKLLGGPQAGVMVGTRAEIREAMRHPIARAVRLDGASIAGLAGVLDRYATAAVLTIPFWQMAAASVDEIRDRATQVAGTNPRVTIVDAESIPGAGSVPGATIPTVAIRIEGDADSAWSALAGWDTPIIATRSDGAVLIDLRSVDPSDDRTVAAAIEGAIV
ncbi:MAG: L-seryl-tRNA(Sec) selenium transferase [Acidimicrobiia bacterium]